MSLYDYKCVNNHYHKDLLRKYEERVIDCPTCGAEASRMYNLRMIAHGLPNGHISAPNTVRREQHAFNEKHGKPSPEALQADGQAAVERNRKSAFDI